jgi:hypothetical protein
VLARVLEDHAVATILISLVREHTEKVKPPRALFVPFPFGHALGRPNDPALQHRVLRAALDLLAEPAGPVLRDLPEDAEPGDQPPAPAQASLIAPAARVPDDPAAETAEMRQHHEQWLAASGGRTALGLSGLPAARLPEAARFLQEFAAGAGVAGADVREGGEASGAQTVDLPGRPSEVPLPNFIRYCADDLKTLYYEGQMAMKPGAGGDELARWFWAETAMGQLLRRVRDRLDASDDPRWKAAAFGIAR